MSYMKYVARDFQRSLGNMEIEKDLKHNQTSSGIPIAPGKSHILQELINNCNESTAEHFDGGLHTSCDFVGGADFSADNFPVEDDAVDDYASKFPITEAVVDKILLGGMYNV